MIVDKSINSDQYLQNMVDSNFIGGMNQIHGELDWVYAQDGARCHTSAQSMEWLEEKVDVINDWPPPPPTLMILTQSSCSGPSWKELLLKNHKKL